MKTVTFEIEVADDTKNERLFPYVLDENIDRFKEIYSAVSSGSVDSLEEPLKSDYWFVLQLLQSILVDPMLVVHPETDYVDPSACPGCECLPGHGRTEGCYDKLGCGA